MNWITALSAAQRGKDGKRKKLAGNTWVEIHEPNGDDNSTVSIRLHDTRIITFHPDGSFSLNSGGWKTVTTKSRINDYIPSGWSLYQEKSIWYLVRHGNADHDRTEFAYADGITIHKDGSVTGQDVDPKIQLKIKRNAAKYVKAYMKALEDGDIEPPSSKDCMYCSLLFKGNHSPDPTHIQSHIGEWYFVPSLLVRAIEAYPVSIFARQWLRTAWSLVASNDKRPSVYGSMSAVATGQLSKSLTRYIYKQLGLAS